MNHYKRKIYFLDILFINTFEVRVPKKLEINVSFTPFYDEK